MSRHKGTFWDNGVILYLDHGGNYMSMCQNAEKSSLFKTVNVTIYILISLISKKCS